MFDERDLVARVLRGNQGAFRQLVKQYEKLVFYVIQKLIDEQEDVEDLAQEVFIKIYKNLSKFKFESKLSTWIGQVAYRESVNYLKKHRKFREGRQEIGEAFQLADVSLNPAQISESNDLGTLVRNAIKLLPEHYRQVLVLFHLEEFTYPEIGQITNMPEGTVKNYIFRARKLLKNHLEPIIKEEK